VCWTLVWLVFFGLHTISFLCVVGKEGRQQCPAVQAFTRSNFPCTMGCVSSRRGGLLSKRLRKGPKKGH
jgi:hypothetical protein